MSKSKSPITTGEGGSKSGDSGDEPGLAEGRDKSLRLGKSKAKETRLVLRAYRQIMKVVRDGKRGGGRRRSARRGRGDWQPPKTRRFNPQRVAVRLTYARNKGDGT